MNCERQFDSPGFTYWLTALSRAGKSTLAREMVKRLEKLMLPSELLNGDIIRKNIICVDCPLEVCLRRVVKGLYKKALSGSLAEFTGISLPDEIPTDPDLTLRTHEESINLPLEESYKPPLR